MCATQQKEKQNNKKTKRQKNVLNSIPSNVLPILSVMVDQAPNKKTHI